MKKVALIYYGSINAPNGAASVMKAIVTGFEDSKEIKLKLYCRDAIDSIMTSDKKKYFKDKLRDFIYKRSINSLYFTRLYYYLSTVKSIESIISKNIKAISEADILFFHDLTSAYTFRKMYFEIWESKHKVIVLHNNGVLLEMFFDRFPMFKKNKKLRCTFEISSKSVMDESDAIVLLSEYSKKNFINFNPINIEKVKIVANGVSSFSSSKQSMEKNNNKIIFVIVGTISKRKGHDLIVDAILSMNNAQRELFEVVIVGDGYFRESVERLILSHNLRNIKLVGSSNDVQRYLVNSDVFLLPSRDEGLPMAIIEAMANSLPVLSTNVGGIPDLIKNNISGWLINSDSMIELKNTMIEIIEKKHNLKLMGTNSYMLYKKKYTKDKMIENYTNIFLNL